MSDGTLQRTGWIVSAVSLGCWAVSALYLAHRVFVVGLSPAQRQAGAEFSQRPFATLTEPLFATLAVTVALGVLAVVSLLYYGYAQWQHAHTRRMALEEGLETGPDRAD